MNRLAISFLFVMALLTLPVSVAFSQTSAPAKTRISLVADHVSFNPTTQILTAKGGVQIFNGPEILTADLIIYDQRKGQIKIPGPLMIISGDTLTTRAKSAILDADLKNGLIRGAEVLIAQQLQLVSNEFHRIDGRYKVFSKTVGSSCQVCSKNPVPYWRIRSRRVIHDEQERQLYFENATVDILGIPIFYAPTLRIPDPTVDRATGFLVPRFSSSNTLGYGLEIPYYKTFGDHADLTFTPKVYSKGSILLNTEYRQMFARGWIDLDTSVTLADNLTSRSVRSSLSARGYLRLNHGFELDMGVEVVSDKSFRSDYTFGEVNQERLTSFATIRRTRADSFVSIGASYIQSLRTIEVDREIPLVFPEIYARKSFQLASVGGTFGLTAQSVVLLRQSSSQFARAGVNFDWENDWISDFGLVSTAFVGLENSVYYTSNYVGATASSFTESVPTLALDFRLPLSRQTGSITHTIEPRLQLVWSTNSARSNPNEDSVQVEFEETNLFSYNRFPGFDATERGLRANIGVTYTRYDPDGWKIGVMVGQILRTSDLGQFGSGTGLSGKNSDFVSAVSLSYKDKFSFSNRALFDQHFNFSKNEAQFALTMNALTTSATYVWLEKDVVANASARRHEASVSADYQYSDYWSYSADWTHNFETRRPSRGKFGITFENECIAVNLSLSLQYEGSGIVRPTHELGLTVQLAGLGNKKRNKKYAHRCAAL